MKLHIGSDNRRIVTFQTEILAGDLYRDGKGVTQDYVQAVAWLQKAADMGNAAGQWRLGQIYRDGNGVSQDDTQAVDWFRRAADRRFADPDHQWQLGEIYRDGKGVTQDYVQAVFWFRKVADQGDPIGQCCLGNMCLLGKGVTQDVVEGTKWFKKAAEIFGNMEGHDMKCTLNIGLDTCSKMDSESPKAGLRLCPGQEIC